MKLTAGRTTTLYPATAMAAPLWHGRGEIEWIASSKLICRMNEGYCKPSEEISRTNHRICNISRCQIPTCTAYTSRPSLEPFNSVSFTMHGMFVLLSYGTRARMTSMAARRWRGPVLQSPAGTEARDRRLGGKSCRRHHDFEWPATNW